MNFYPAGLLLSNYCIKISIIKVEFNEQELLKELAQNNKQVVESIYVKNYPVIEALILNNNGSYDDAQDVFQETMIVLYENAKRPDFLLTSQLKTYVYAIAKRLWLKRLQQQKYNYEIVDVMDVYASVIGVDETLEEYKKRNNEFEIMNEALNNIGEPCKGLLKACYIQKKSMKEIAENFGYTNADNAKNQKYKCLMRLKKIFFDLYKK